MEIENEIKLAHAVEVLIKNLDVVVHNLKNKQLIDVLVDNGDEVETGVLLVNNFVVFPLEKVVELGAPCEHDVVDFLEETGSLVGGEAMGEPLGQSGLALAVDEKETVDHG